MATEKRLIDVDVAVKKAHESDKIVGSSIWETSEVVEFLEGLPTVDAVEVVHGRWEWRTEDIYRCSNCGEDAHVKEVMGQPDWNYCTNCGANMEGDGNV